jgi:hypothetical protein
MKHFGIDEKSGFGVEALFDLSPALDGEVKFRHTHGGDLAEVVAAQEAGQFAQLGIVKDEKEAFDLVVLHREDLQYGIGIGAIELPEIVDASFVFKPFGQGVGGALGPERAGGEDRLGMDASKSQIGADGSQVRFAPGA